MKGLWGHFDPITIAKYANPSRPHDDRFRIQLTEPTRKTRTTEQKSSIEYDHYVYTIEYKVNQGFQSEEEEAKGLI